MNDPKNWHDFGISYTKPFSNKPETVGLPLLKPDTVVLVGSDTCWTT